MEDARPFRLGLFVLAFFAAGSFAAIVALALASSEDDFRVAENSWNCSVSQSTPTIFGPTFCLPQPLQLAILSFAVSCTILGALAINRSLVKHWEIESRWTKTLVRFGIAVFAVGATISFQFFVAAYILQYRSVMALVIVLATVAIIGHFVFPRTSLLFLVCLTIPLTIFGFFAGVLLAAMLGIPFD